MTVLPNAQYPEAMPKRASARPSPVTTQSPGEQRDVQRFKQLTEEVLPTLARDQRWPIRFDHCFKRICLDHAFEDVWYNHLPRPAERHLAGDPLQRALQCAEDLTTGGLPLLRERDAASLRYRGKRPKAESSAS